MSFQQAKRREKSARELRRLAEKQERRQALQIPEYKRAQMAAEQAVMERIQRNGITVQDLKENYDKGWSDGFKMASEPVIRTCYAAICLAAKELYGFGQKRCCDLLNAVDQKIIFSLTSEEAIQEVWDKLGLQLDFKEVLDDRITVREDEGK